MLLSLRSSLTAHAVQLLAVCCWLIPSAAARRHNFFVGNLNLPAAIHSLYFDDETFELNVSRHLAADSSHSWITFNHDMTHVYGASLDAPRIATYEIVNSTMLRMGRPVIAQERCANRTSAFIIASKRFPHYVFTASWPGPNACGMTAYADPPGQLMDTASTWWYGARSGIHGMALGWNFGQIFYTADMGSDSIWTHAFGFYGEAYFMGRYSVPAGARPRHIAAHPYGKYVYAVMEGTNQLVPYVLDPYSGTVMNNETAHSLIPSGHNSSNYWSSDVMLSRNNRYLWATSRGRANSTYGGYISGFLIDNDGRIIKKMFTVPVSASSAGGAVNSLTTAPWDDEWAVITDAATGYVQMWRMRGGRETEFGVEYNTAEAVAKADVVDGGCCSNAIWYN